jgi:hypothetical protein
MKLKEAIQLFPRNAEIRIFPEKAAGAIPYRRCWPLVTDLADREVEEISSGDHMILILLAPKPEAARTIVLECTINVDDSKFLEAIERMIQKMREFCGFDPGVEHGCGNGPCPDPDATTPPA